MAVVPGGFPLGDEALDAYNETVSAAILQAILTLWRLTFGVLNAVGGLIPAVNIASLFVYAFAALSMALFLLVFHRTQSR